MLIQLTLEEHWRVPLDSDALDWIILLFLNPPEVCFIWVIDYWEFQIKINLDSVAARYWWRENEQHRSLWKCNTCGFEVKCNSLAKQLNNAFELIWWRLNDNSKDWRDYFFTSSMQSRDQNLSSLANCSNAAADLFFVFFCFFCSCWFSVQVNKIFSFCSLLWLQTLMNLKERRECLGYFLLIPNNLIKLLSLTPVWFH